MIRAVTSRASAQDIITESSDQSVVAGPSKQNIVPGCAPQENQTLTERRGIEAVR